MELQILLPPHSESEVRPASGKEDSGSITFVMRKIFTNISIIFISIRLIMVWSTSQRIGPLQVSLIMWSKKFIMIRGARMNCYRLTLKYLVNENYSNLKKEQISPHRPKFKVRNLNRAYSLNGVNQSNHSHCFSQGGVRLSPHHLQCTHYASSQKSIYNQFRYQRLYFSTYLLMNQD